jgi:hypothetical protein
MIYLFTTFDMPGYNSLLVIAINSKAKKFFALSPCCYYTFRKKKYLNKLAYFPKTYYHTSVQVTKMGVCNCAPKAIKWPQCRVDLDSIDCAPISDIRASAMLVLLIVGN